MRRSVAEFRAESDQWFVVRQPRADLAGISAAELLRRTQGELLAPLRYAKEDHGIVLIGEYPLQAGGGIERGGDSCVTNEAREMARQTLHGWLRGRLTHDVSPPCEPPDDATIEGLLSEFSPQWTCGEEHWIVAAGVQSPVELIVARTPRGVRVEGRLQGGESNTNTPKPPRALAEFLLQCQLGFRFARLEWRGTVCVVSEAEAPRLDDHLEHCLASVAQVCRLISAEVEALDIPEVAQEYLNVVCKDN